MITQINESKILTKHISWKCQFKFEGRKCNSNQKWNNDKCRCECKNPKEHNVCKRNYIKILATSAYENGKHSGRIIYASVITCDEIITLQIAYQQML